MVRRQICLMVNSNQQFSPAADVFQACESASASDARSTPFIKRFVHGTCATRKHRSGCSARPPRPLAHLAYALCAPLQKLHCKRRFLSSLTSIRLGNGYLNTWSRRTLHGQKTQFTGWTTLAFLASNGVPISSGRLAAAGMEIAVKLISRHRKP